MSSVLNQFSVISVLEGRVWVPNAVSALYEWNNFFDPEADQQNMDAGASI